MLVLMRCGDDIINLDAIAYAEWQGKELYIETIGNPSTTRTSLIFTDPKATAIWKFLVSRSIADVMKLEWRDDDVSAG